MSETATLSMTEFLLACIAEDEVVAQAALGASGHSPWRAESYRVVVDEGDFEVAEAAVPTAQHIARHDPARVLAECEAKRRIVKLHESWPVLVQTQPTFETTTADDVNAYAMRASQQIAWLTEQEYRGKFGEEPPTAPMLAALASVYSDHPDYRDEWRP